MAFIAGALIAQHVASRATRDALFLSIFDPTLLPRVTLVTAIVPLVALDQCQTQCLHFLFMLFEKSQRRSDNFTCVAVSSFIDLPADGDAGVLGHTICIPRNTNYWDDTLRVDWVQNSINL